MIYFISYGESDWIKVGFAREVGKRFNQLQVSSPERLTIEATVEGTQEQEQRLHRAIGGPRRGEWFKSWWVAGEVVEQAKAGMDAEGLIAFAQLRRETIEGNIAADKAERLIACWAATANDENAKDHQRALCRKMLIERDEAHRLTPEAVAFTPDLSWIETLPPKARPAARSVYEAVA